jgi:hypothetical protein
MSTEQVICANVRTPHLQFGQLRYLYCSLHCRLHWHHQSFYFIYVATMIPLLLFEISTYNLNLWSYFSFWLINERSTHKTFLIYLQEAYSAPSLLKGGILLSTINWSITSQLLLSTIKQSIISYGKCTCKKILMLY